MEKVNDSYSSSEPVTPTSNDMMKPLRVLKVEAESSEMGFQKIKGVLEKLEEETHDIDTYYNERKGTAIVLGSFDPEELKMKLENEAGDAIESITDPTESVRRGRYAFVHAMPLLPPMRVSIMRVPEVADSRSEILNHSEIPMELRNYDSDKTMDPEASQGSRRCCW